MRCNSMSSKVSQKFKNLVDICQSTQISSNYNQHQRTIILKLVSDRKYHILITIYQKVLDISALYLYSSYYNCIVFHRYQVSVSVWQYRYWYRYLYESSAWYRSRYRYESLSSIGIDISIGMVVSVEHQISLIRLVKLVGLDQSDKHNKADQVWLILLG